MAACTIQLGWRFVVELLWLSSVHVWWVGKRMRVSHCCLSMQDVIFEEMPRLKVRWPLKEVILICLPSNIRISYRVFPFMLCKKSYGISLTLPLAEASFLLLCASLSTTWLENCLDCAIANSGSLYITPKKIENTEEKGGAIEREDEQSKGHDRKTNKQIRHRWRAGIAACVLT